MSRGRNYLQDWMNGDLEDEEYFEPFQNTNKQKDLPEDVRRKQFKKKIDQKRSKSRERKENDVTP